MLTRNAATVTSFLKVGAAAGAALSMLAGLAVAAPTSLASEGSAGETHTGVSARLDAAATLLADRKPVMARGQLLDLSRSGAAMTDREATRLASLLSNANKALKALPPSEVSLQTAEDALTRDELTLAERHARAVVEAPDATNAQSAAARQMLDTAAARRAQFEGQGDAMVADAVAAFDAGNVDEARSLLSRVTSMGLSVNAQSATQVAEYKTRIVLRDEAASGRAMAGMMQPGVINPIGEEPAGTPVAAAQPPAASPEMTPVPPAPATTSQPAPAGTGEIVIPPIRDEVPAPAAAPVAADAPAAAPAPAPAAAAPADGGMQSTAASSDPIAMARALEAQAVLAGADKAFEEGRMNEAAGEYDRVLRDFGAALNADQRLGAERRLAEARARLNVGGGNLLDSVINQRELQRQQVMAEFKNDMERAARALETGDPTAARNLVASANLRINAGRNVLAEPEFEAFAGEVRDLRARIDAEENRIQAENARLRSEELQRQVADASQRAASERDRKISEAVDRVRALQREMKYEEALQVTEQILFLDPINPTGLLLRDVLSDMIVVNRFNGIRERQNRSFASQDIDNKESLIAPVGFIEYGANWPRISAMRGDSPAFSDSEDDQRVLATLQSRRIPVNFNETPLANVLEFFKAVTLLNMDVDWQSLEAAGINRDTPVTLNLSNVTVENAMSRVVERVSPDQFSGAAWSIADGVVTVASREVINRNKALVIYDIRDIVVEVPDYINAPEIDLESILQQGGGEGGGQGQSPFEEEDEDIERRDLDERVNEIIDIITTNVDPNGWQANGGDVGMIQQLGGNLIITNTPANHRAIHGLLTKLRAARAVQINVETRFLLVSQDFFEQIGFDIDLYFNAKNNQVRAARGTDPNFRPSDLFNVDNSRLERQTVNTSGTAGAGGIRPATGNPPTPTQGLIPVVRPSPLSVIGAPGNSLGLTESLTVGDFAGNILQGAPALGVSGQFLDDIQVDFLIKATQADRRTVTLTAPRLTFTNGQTSNIYVATQRAFISDLTPVVAEDAVGFDPELGVVTEGVVLLVDGTVTSDRRYVVLNVDTSVGVVDGFRTIPVSAVAGGAIINSGELNQFVEAPTVTVTRVQTTVTVPDQGTILLGGQRLITESEVETGVPVLSKIPLLNRFFTNRTETREEQTLLILLKPTILIQSENEEKSFPGLNESLRMGGGFPN